MNVRYRNKSTFLSTCMYMYMYIVFYVAFFLPQITLVNHNSRFAEAPLLLRHQNSTLSTGVPRAARTLSGTHVNTPTRPALAGTSHQCPAHPNSSGKCVATAALQPRWPGAQPAIPASRTNSSCPFGVANSTSAASCVSCVGGR